MDAIDAAVCLARIRDDTTCGAERAVMRRSAWSQLRSPVQGVLPSALSRKLSLAAGPAKDNSDTMKPPPDPHYRHRFPAEVISHAVWLYHVLSLSLRDVELLLAERGIVVSYETVRRWCKKFGQSFANLLRRRRPLPGDKWHLDEVFIQIQGVQHYLWRAVDQNGVVTRHPGSGTPRRQSCQAFLGAFAEGSALCSAGDCDRQAEELRRGETSAAP